MFCVSCDSIEDDLSDCVQMRVYADFDDPEPIEWGNYFGTRTLIDNHKYAKIYIFDKEYHFIASHIINTTTVVELPYKQYDSIRYVLISSNDINNSIFPEYHSGDKLNDSIFISLDRGEDRCNIKNIAKSPVDFQIDNGYIKTIRSDIPMAPHYLYLKRKVGAIRCIVIGLEKFLEKNYANKYKNDDPVTVIFGDTKNKINYKGNYVGEWVSYAFSQYNNRNDTIVTEYINSLASLDEKESEIKVFKGDLLVNKKDATKNAARVRQGQVTTVIINFNELYSSEGGFGVSSDEWDPVNVDAQF
ncbi:MAG: hypothetical protein H6Q15_1544 [Bacteroidetes bacterium]|nr:hypothetical protein [Bacteroidota bacterium]